ncbi:MAG: hypothetical protein AAF513_19120 [Pseudomonadota bacterium]
MSNAATTRIIIGNGQPGRCEPGPYTTDSLIAEPFGLVFGPDQRLYFCDLGNHRICALDLAARQLQVIAGNGIAGHDGDGGPATQACLTEPYELRFDAAGNLYFVDMQAHVIRKIDAHGSISTIAGSGTRGFSGDGGPAAQASFDAPHAIELSPDDKTLYVADIGNHRLRGIELSTGTINTLAGTGEQAPIRDTSDLAHLPLNGPRTLAFGSRGEVFLALREGNAIYRLDLAARSCTHLAGNGKFGYRGDGGPAVEARLAGPKGIAANATTVYIADTESHTVRAIDLGDGTISTVLGSGEQGFVNTQIPHLCALARPHGVCLDAQGRLYVGDSDNHCIRVLEKP